MPESLTRVLLFRHAETADPSVFHGAESDIGLSRRGQLQAQRLAAYLATRRPEVLVCSGMRRARDTAAAVGLACGLTPEIEPQLHERRLGGLSGMPTGDRSGPWMQTVQRWIQGDTGFSLLGAESFDEVRQRVVTVWQHLTQRHAGKTLAVIAHGAVIKVLLLSIVAEYGPADWMRLGAIQNVALHELVATPAGWKLERFNECVIVESNLSPEF
ncbi:MAG: histidine phosphatase family protein [Gemmataceae bacterium]